jgi:4-hydroxy-tetrahydrodipicolinate synthase
MDLSMPHAAPLPDATGDLESLSFLTGVCMFSGAITAMVTPFREGRLDENRLREQVEYQIKNGIDGLVPVGTTGESPTLDFKEHARVLELTVQFARGRVPVIAGVGANATTEALELHQIAKRVGATAGLSVNPYYNKPTQEGLYRHFMTLADRVDLPIVLYNIPGRTGVTMSAQTVARLSEHRNIVAIKEATGSLDMASEIMSLCDITVLSGDDSLTVPLMSIGATGIVSVASNLIPSQIKTMTKAALEGNFKGAREIHLRLFQFIRSLFLDGNPVGIKYAMKAAGLDSGELRLPLWEAGDATRKLIEQHLKTLGITPKAL